MDTARIRAHPRGINGAVKDLQSGETMPVSNGRFLAKAVPANGYKTFAATFDAERCPMNRTFSTTLETAFYRVSFDLQRGAIASLVDKASGRELVDKTSPYALGQFLHERFSITDVQRLP